MRLALSVSLNSTGGVDSFDEGVLFRGFSDGLRARTCA